MTVLALDHFNIRTTDLPGTIAFFRDVLGMTLAPAPGAGTIEQGAWALDDAGRPIVHIGTAEGTYPTDARLPFTAARGSASVHHVALECRDPDAVRAKLLAAGYEIDENEIPSIGLRQIFVQEANGVLLELNFRS